jgi:uncharacterized protein involved in propanediol utilization
MLNKLIEIEDTQRQYNSLITNSYHFGFTSASFGEIIQGQLSCGTNFLVTLPISKGSRVMFSKCPESKNLYIGPGYKIKLAKLIKTIEQEYGIKITGSLNVKCEVPEGKGISSSTADLVSCCKAVASAYDIKITSFDVDHLLSSVEPSDGLAHDGSVVYDYKRCRLLKKLDYVPPFTILCVDEGGVLDTVNFNKSNLEISKSQKDQYQKLEIAFINQDLSAIARIATNSTLFWQKYNKKSSLEKVIRICEEIKGLGVINTHSGTCLGILLNPFSKDLQAQITKAKKALGYLTIYHSLYETSFHKEISA